MAVLLNTNYWKKAYLLEFKSNGKLTDAFTFSVPPESEEFVFPQRKNETKTFGGVVVADYGNDLVQITLSGSTINQDLKLIYKGTLGTTTMTGEQEAFYLRDLLKKYGQQDKLKNKEVTLYSLNGGVVAKKTPKWWRIYVGDLTISRSKDKPFCYNYKLTATGAPEVTKKQSLLASAVESVMELKEAISGIVADITNFANLIEEYGGAFLDDLRTIINTCKDCIGLFESAVARYADVVNGIVEGATDLATDTVALGDKVLFTAFRYYPTVAADVWNTCVNAKESLTNLYDYCANIGEEYFSQSAWQSVKELFSDSVSDEDIADSYSTLSDKAMSLMNNAASITSKVLNDLGVAVKPGDMGQNDQIIMTYGYKVVSVTDAETSWDQIANDYYGDATLSYILATYNNLPTDKPLKAGQSILIPNLNFAESRIADNEVYNTPDVKDNYGKDLVIEDKDFAVYNGDLKTIGGIKNLDQSLLNRYSTLIGARIRLEAYGIQASIGDALNATSALIQASVHQTTVEDPRVDSVENIDFVGNGDNLTVSVVYVDKNGIKRNFGGTI